jgi:cytochrome c
MALALALTLEPAIGSPVNAEPLYAAHCARCHGAQGQGGQGFARPIWGPASDLRRFGTAQGLLEYLLLLMPFDDPARLAPEQKQVLVRYMLWRHGSIGAAALEGDKWDGQTPIR